VSSLESEAHDGTANRQRSKSEMGYGTDPGAKFNHKAYASEGVTLNQPTLKRMDRCMHFELCAFSSCSCEPSFPVTQSLPIFGTLLVA
jgi:hypothetical protein